VNVQKTLPNKPTLNNTVCVAPTNGAGIQLRGGGPRPGRLVFSGQTDSYNGSVAVFSDDGGASRGESGRGSGGFTRTDPLGLVLTAF
jgi:hypothetical protein